MSDALGVCDPATRRAARYEPRWDRPRRPWPRPSQTWTGQSWLGSVRIRRVATTDGSWLTASCSDRRCAACTTSSGTHSGKRCSQTRWAPELVCSSWIAANRSRGSRSATRTRAGHKRRWMRVTFPLTSLVRTTSGESASTLSVWKIAWLHRWPHQLPRIGSPATSSATFGSGPRADSRSIPCLTSTAIGSIAVILPPTASTHADTELRDRT